VKISDISPFFSILWHRGPLARELGGIFLTILKLLLAAYKNAKNRLRRWFSFGDINAQISSSGQRRLANMRKMTCLAKHNLGA